MAINELDIANGALERLGAKPISSLTEETGRAKLCNRWITKVRRQALRAHPWNCALVRTMLSTFPNATLTSGAISGTGVSFTASAPVFAAGLDEAQRIITADNKTARIVKVVDPQTVTADIETDLTSVAALAPGSWRIAPAWEWQYRYSKPENYLRVARVETIDGSGVISNGPPFQWTWWSRGQRDNSPVPVKVEGQYIISNVGPRIFVQYIQDLTDVTLFDPLLDEAIEALLAFRIAYGVTGSLGTGKAMHDAYRECLAEARSIDGQEGTGDDSGSDILLAVRG